MNTLPLMNHRLDESTAFCPEDLVATVRKQRGTGGAGRSIKSDFSPP